MLPKKQRLTKKDFDHYFRVGKRYHSQNLQLIYAVTTDFHGAAVAGKKVFKTAVKRNALRRRLYAVLYRFSKTTDIKGIFILIAKPTAATTNPKDLIVEAQALLAMVRKRV